MPIPEESLIDIGSFKGVNNIDHEADIDEFARDLENVDLGRDGRPCRRSGYTKQLTLVDGHSLHNNGNVSLVVSSGKLQKLNTETMTLTELTSVAGTLSYVDIESTTYYTDGTNIGRVLSDGTQAPVWVVNPTGSPTVTANAIGSMQPGKYQVAITNIDENGIESGSDIATSVELTSTGGISITNIPQGAAYVRIYLTAPGGEIFYSQTDVPIGVTSIGLLYHMLGRELATQFASSMPAGNSLAYHFGRILVASNGYIYYSLPIQPGLTRITDNYLPIGSDVVIMASDGVSGVYVVTDSDTHYISGKTPDNYTIKPVYPHGAVPGTLVMVPAGILGLEYSASVPCWLSDNGMVAGLPEGQVMAFTEKTVAMSAYNAGASLYREKDGIRSIVTSAHGGDTSQLAMGDSVSFTVIRNGIVI